MKYLNFSRQCSFIVGAAIVLFSSCKKVENFEAIGDGGQKYVKIIDYGGIKGTSGFTQSALVLDLSLPTQSVPMQLELTTAQVYPQDITVTVGYSAAKLTAFNAAQPAGGTIFTALTAAQYSLSTTTVKIKAGQTMSETFNVIFRPDQLDVASSYMLPIEIKSISGGNGEIAAPGSGTAYFRIIGNYLAGKYSWRYRRWQGNDTTAAPLQDLVNITNLLPITATSLKSRETYTETFVDPAGGIILGFNDAGGGVLSGFNLSLLPSTIAGIPAGGFVLIEGPKFTAGGFKLVGNAASKFIGTQFATYIQYQNSTPAFRSLVNEFTKIP
jgi:hypothetical protein